MRVEYIKLRDFKRFTNLTITDIPEKAKMVVLVGPNGSGKTSLMEAMNHFYQLFGHHFHGDYSYLSKLDENSLNINKWAQCASQVVNISFHDVDITKIDLKRHFYFRSAYRNEPNFQINSMQKQDDPTQRIRLTTLIQNDTTVSSNYQRLIANTISGVYNTDNDKKSVEELRNELLGLIRKAISNIFEDLVFSSVGEPLTNGNFYFTKGTKKDFSYKNLSAGEKSAFDLILDIVIKSKYYPDAVYCIDEPELHMHTKLQGKVLRELYSLIPNQSQLWVSTHSIGMLQEAEDIEKENPGTVVFLDFGNRNFDTDQIIYPSKIGKAVLDKFYELAFGDFAKLLLPKTVVFCEGHSNGRKRKNFDKEIYSKIFADTHPEAFFISAGSCNDIENIEKNSGEIIRTILKGTRVIKIIDRDDRSDAEIQDLAKKGIRVLKKRNLESYLFDDSVIKKLCDSVGHSNKYDDCICKKKDAMKNSIARGNPTDDYKSAQGDIYNFLKQNLNLKKCGNNAETFIRDTLTTLITPDMDVYRELEYEIFGELEVEGNT